MKGIALALLFLLSACAHMPQIQQADTERQSQIENRCRSLFPRGHWQLVHIINARFFGGRQAAMTGVIVLSTEDSTVHCVLMTLEGLVLFEAVDNGEVSVKRAFGPFDNDEFAKGVMKDIRFVFFRPGDNMIAAGNVADDAQGCRYQADGGRVIDVLSLNDGSWQIKQYDPSGSLLRTVTADAVNPNGISPRLTLETDGRHPYRLAMTLIEAVPLQ